MRIHVSQNCLRRLGHRSTARLTFRYISNSTPNLAAQTYTFVPSHSLFAKRPPRPFPPPFNSPPTSSLTDPLTTHFHSRPGYTRPVKERTEGASFLSGLTNGDDAVLTTTSHIAVADGVGAWNTKSHGHAALWSRLMLHFWSAEVSSGPHGFKQNPQGADPVLCLQAAYEATIAATSSADTCQNKTWQGTTTVCCAVMNGENLVVLNLGDSVGLVYRPGKNNWVLRTKEQWHWFDCPRQLGTNSPDTPVGNSVVQELAVQDGDLVILASDGLVDNIWDEEILEIIRNVMAEPENTVQQATGEGGDRGRMALLSDRLVESARKTAINPFAESPYMERSIEEGLAMEGGKFDDISVVSAVCRCRNQKPSA
ncbi:phosphatase 2C-like domain-containing protein [Geopyxis carbonaria]|nr:phosphatase 2C-like domain-containing protein [Geopyxis carbonaria]